MQLPSSARLVTTSGRQTVAEDGMRPTDPFRVKGKDDAIVLVLVGRHICRVERQL